MVTYRQSGTTVEQVPDHPHPFTPSGCQGLLFQLAGVVPSPLLLELLSCPLCARSLETLELELGDLEGGKGEADGLHDFPQVRVDSATFSSRCHSFKL